MRTTNLNMKNTWQPLNPKPQTSTEPETLNLFSEESTRLHGGRHASPAPWQQMTARGGFRVEGLRAYRFRMQGLVSGLRFGIRGLGFEG